MSDQNFKNDSQKYLDEMMKFYSMNKNASVNTVSNQNDVTESIGDIEIPNGSTLFEDESDLAVQDTANEMPNTQETTDVEENSTFEEKLADSIEKKKDFEERFPDPVIPDFMRGDPSIPIVPILPGISENSLPPPKILPHGDYGFLKVEVRAGNNGVPLENAVVTVTKGLGHSEELLFSGTTDRSGIIDKIKLPAPYNMKGNTLESYNNFALYAVNAFSDGFYRETNYNIKIFAGITAIQRFNMIPKPFNYNDFNQAIVLNTEKS